MDSRNRSDRGCAAAVGAPRRATHLPPPPAGARDALDQRRLHDDPARQRPQHLQRPSDAVLGPRLGDRNAVALDPRPRTRRRARSARRASAAPSSTTTGVLGVSKVNGRDDGARLPELGDDPRAAVAGDGAPLALLLRLAVRRQRRRLRALHDLQPPPGDATWCRRATSCGTSAARSSTTSSSSIRPAPRRRATTCCRASPTWSSSSCCCR